MTFTVVIPARYASQRLPGKPLLKIGQRTMIECVYQQAQKSAAQRVIVATDHADIEADVRRFGGQVCMTRSDHASGTDRLAEVVDNLGLSDDAIIVNVQGDEPLIPPAVIDQVAMNLQQRHEASVATVSHPIEKIATYQNSNAVKVVSNILGMALYFSRAPIPFYRDEQQHGDAVLKQALEMQQCVQQHVGIYAYKSSLLRQFVTWPEGTLETIEKLEQLRVLENGHHIHVEQACESVPGGVDTQADLEYIRTLLE